MMEFHISRQARDRYQFDQSLFSYNGNLILANFHSARQLAQKMNQKLDLVSYPEQAIKAGQINAMGLMDEIMHHVFHLYHQQRNPDIFEKTFEYLESHLGRTEVDRLLTAFIQDFPPLDVYQKEISAEEYLQSETDGVPNRWNALEELIILWIENKNPALEPFQELLDDHPLQNNTQYLRAFNEIEAFFKTQPKFGPEQQSLLVMFRSPSIIVPHSLSGQLDYIREHWGELLGRYLYRLLSSLDLIKEENKLPFMGPGPVPIPVYDAAAAGLMGGIGAEQENFSPDREWMPRLVLMAKNTFVWLDQLAKKYQRPISRLDQIPDEELDILARRGFTGLWLIGLWERSQASARIKQLCGNPDAISSAYSLANYSIAWELGGDEAYRNLRDRAWQRGIRLASDMVPNHMGMDSSWVTEHPDWFVSLDYSPYPAYSFNGPNLSNDPRVSLYLEDHYYDRTDAAVVFQHVENSTGQRRYIYHGNDGTTMPWNDTAQLNYLNPAVREAVIQTILDVARRFPIIRFDAAMTLAQRHYERLWFPEPGSGGAIPSRAEHALTKEQFYAAFPVEFWREVVDRCAVEAPDTLLLAEAFWLMESYFVRTLGMHRVYNSAFMNLVRNEENDKYRLLMKNTLEFDPEILKRFVNFMNNPDERTAADQFGKGDKYFGICVLMATLPGLPMFGHGQIEGFSEKYGMEFRRALWEEQVDEDLVHRHEREIFPILHKRALFAGVDLFLLYDFFTPEGSVNEDVFAYSNGLGDERTLVVYHNRFANTSGWIRWSVSYIAKTGGDERSLTQKTLADGLYITADEHTFMVFTDSVTNLEYIRPTREIVERGLHLNLGAYKYHVFLNFRVLSDDEFGSYRRICEYLNGRGVPSIEDALQELLLAPVQQPFHQIANSGYFRHLMALRISTEVTSIPVELLTEAEEKMAHLLDGIAYLSGFGAERDAIKRETRQKLGLILSLEHLDTQYPVPGGKKYRLALEDIQAGLKSSPARYGILFSWLFTHHLGKATGAMDYESQSETWLDEWQFARILTQVAAEMGVSQENTWRMATTLRLLISEQNWYSQMGTLPAGQILKIWLAKPEIQTFLGINRYKDILWFNQEALIEFTWWMQVLAVLQAGSAPVFSASHFLEAVLGASEIADALRTAEKESAYQVSKLLAALEEKVLPIPEKPAPREEKKTVKKAAK